MTLTLISKRLFAALVVSCTLAGSGVAFAQAGTMPDWANKKGAVGIGGNTTLGGVNGLNFRTYVSPLFGLYATLGFNISNGQADAGGIVVDVSQTVFQGDVGGEYRIVTWNQGAVAGLAGFGFRSLSDSIDDGMGNTLEESATDVLIGLGARGEYFPTQYFSIFMQAGLRLDFLGAENADDRATVLEFNMGESLAVDLSQDLYGAAGFTVWFK